MTDQKTSDFASRDVPTSSRVRTEAVLSALATEQNHEIGEWSRDAWRKAKRDGLKTDAKVDDARRWFVLTVGQWCERRVAVYLVAYGIKCFLPLVGEYQRRGVRRRKVWTLVPMFPEYVFVRLDWHADKKARRRIRAIPGVVGFLEFGEYLAVADDDTMRKIESASNAARIESNQPSIWKIGERVQVTEGYFAGEFASVTKLDRNGRIEVLLSSLGRLSLEVEKIAKL